MARAPAWLLLLSALLAGCSQEPAAQEDAAVTGPVVEGWVLDAALKPVAGARVVLAGLGLQDNTTDDGHFLLQAPPGSDLLVTVTADGFRPASQAVGAASGAVHVLQFRLERIPDAKPFRVVQDHAGVLQCGAVAVLVEDQGSPHEHEGVRCSALMPDGRNQWLLAIPDNTTGIVLEVVWEAQSPASQALVLKVTEETTGKALGFFEGPSILRLQMGQAPLDLARRAGPNLLVVLEAGAGTGDHEHGAVGLFLEQQFTIYATAFFNGPVDPAYTIADA